MSIKSELKKCRICADRFAATETQHRPRPVVWFRNGARILLASQAPGARAHASERPFTDPSGDRLRDWLGVSSETFYDQTKFAIVPIGFCFPGYDAKGSDIPPPRICAETWRDRVLTYVGPTQLRIYIGGYAQKWHLKTRRGVTETVRDQPKLDPDVFALPHPSWRNTAWMRKNPWFEAMVLPALKTRVKEVLDA
ncbi:MAG: uracil-DNA glycosylase family protein [Paracoccaceae bacterium]